jgi:A/G-specific adenine glycosylase
MAESCNTGSLDKARLRLFARRLLKWFVDHGRDLPWRKADQSLYRRVVAEVLLQRTKAETVAALYDGFFSQYPDWSSLANADKRSLEDSLRPFGLWKQRAPRLNALAQAMISRGGVFPPDRAELLKLPAVGHYVANSILLFAFHRSAPLLDTNMSRVLERHFGRRRLADIRYDQYLNDLASGVVSFGDSILINWAILDLAATVCLQRNPLCDECPVSDACRHRILTSGHAPYDH